MGFVFFRGDCLGFYRADENSKSRSLSVTTSAQAFPPRVAELGVEGGARCTTEGGRVLACGKLIDTARQLCRLRTLVKNCHPAY